MQALWLSLLGGSLLGLAGAFHCAAMCGGLAASGAMVFSQKSRLHNGLTLAAMMTGRIAVYAMLGALLAASAELTIAMTAMKPSLVPMPWIGAVMLVGIGLSTAGFFPAFSLPGNGVVSLVSHADRLLAPARRVPFLAPFAVGMVWGLAPCPMIYAALFSAALTGSPVSGLIWMLGFGLGTVPAVLLSALGIKFLAHINAGRAAKVIAGFAIAAFGLATIFLDLPVFSAICLPSS